MELAIRIHVELQPEGVYLATSDDVQGLVVQGRTVAETLEFARDAAKKLIEATRERDGGSMLPGVASQQDFMIVVGA